jgi:TolB-like protein
VAGVIHKSTKCFAVVLIGLAIASGCSGRMKPTKFTNPRFDFAYIERVAVLPFENLTADRQAAWRSTRLVATELLASGAVDVVEAGEVQAALAKIQGTDYGRITSPPTEQIIALGKDLNVQAVVMGTVTQSELSRSGQVSIPVVTLDMRMVETETGATVWAATHTEKGGSTGAKVLGTGGEPISQTTRRCVKILLSTLVD